MRCSWIWNSKLHDGLATITVNQRDDITQILPENQVLFSTSENFSASVVVPEILKFLMNYYFNITKLD